MNTMSSKVRNGAWYVILLLIMLQAVAAQGLPPSVTRVLQTFTQYMQNPYIMYFLTFLFLFILFYSIFAGAARMVHVFAGEGHGLNKQGKTFAVSLSFLANFAIFFIARQQGMSIPMLLHSILQYFGMFGGLMLAGASFLLVYRGFHQDVGGGWAFDLALFIAGGLLILFGTILLHDTVLFWGYLIATFAVIIAFILLVTHHGGPPHWGGPHPPGGYHPPPGPYPPPAPPGPPGGPHPPAGTPPVTPYILNTDPPTTPYMGGVRLYFLPNNPPANVTQYRVEYRRGGRMPGWMPFNWHHQNFGTALPTDPAYPGYSYVDITGLQDMHNYQFRIRAENLHGHSGWSNAITRQPNGMPWPGAPAVIWLPHTVPVVDPVTGLIVYNTIWIPTTI